MERNEFGNGGGAQQVTGAVRVAVRMNEIPRYFDTNGLCAQDIIAYIRHKDRYPDSRQIVIMDTDEAPIDMERLADNRIYYGGPRGNEKSASAFSGTTAISVPVYVEDMNPDMHTCGLDEICAKISQEFCIEDFGLLLCGTKKDIDILLRAWQYMADQKYKCVVPDFVLRESARDKNAIDIAKTVERLDYLAATSNLTRTALLTAVNEIGHEIEERMAKGEKVSILSSASVHNKLTRQIMFYLVSKFNASPKFIESYLDSYVDGHVAYDHTRMSLYERFQWLRNLPEAFGYLGPNLRFHCFCELKDEGLFVPQEDTGSKEIALSNGSVKNLHKELASRIYPIPLYAAYVRMDGSAAVVFRPDEGTGVPELDAHLSKYMELFNYADYGDAVNFVDFRVMFPGSKEFFDDSKTAWDNTTLATLDSPYAQDVKVDEQWRKIFTQMSQFVLDRYGENIAPTVKNCILFPIGKGELLVLYCPGSLGVNCMLKSEYFDKDIQIIGEEAFHRLIDIRTLLALISRDQPANDADIAKGRERFDLVMSKRYSNLRPWIDEEVILVLNTLVPTHTELSYYDRMLRAAKNMFPIVTDKDDKLYNEEDNAILESIRFVSLMNQDNSNERLYGCTCFGTCEDIVSEGKAVVGCTIEIAEGSDLL